MSLTVAGVRRALSAAREWSVLFQHQERASLHLTKGGAIETSIESVRKQADVTVYERVGTRMGDAHCTLFDERDAAARITEAKTIARLSMKEAWPLPGKQRYGRVATSDPQLATLSGRKREALLTRVWRALERAAKRERGVRISHAELVLAATRNRVCNSEGLDGQSKATSLFVELIMTARARGAEQEFHQAVTVGRLADLSPTRFVKECAAKARDVLAAQPLDHVWRGAVTLSGDALRDFWAPDLTLSPLVAHANAQAKYRGLSTFAEGKVLTTNPFTLTSDPFVPYNPSSGRFDTEGTASKRITLVKDGRVAGFFANQRYAHYLGVPPTGALGVISLSTGRERARTLLRDTIEIVSFSSFVPNSLSGDFSAEIRLGYLHRDGKRVPIKGAMFTGNLFRMLDGMRRSKEEVVVERYKGPAVIRFEEGCHLAGFSE